MFVASGLTRGSAVPAVVLMMGNPALAAARIIFLECEIDAPVETVFAAWADQIAGEGQHIIAQDTHALLTVEWALPTPALHRHRTSLTLTFERRGSARTTMTITHAGFGKGEAWDEALAWFAQGWPAVAAEMKAAIEAGQ